MALNPFFLQGSQSEQRLVQSLINEQLQIYGVDVIYLPRKILSKDEILTEVQSSTFNDNYAIEAYINTYEGYTGCLLYTSPSPRDSNLSRMPSSA